MKKLLVLFSVVIFIPGLSRLGFAQATSPAEPQKIYKWYSQPYRPTFRYTKDTNLLPLIQVKGNRLVNSLGDTILFRGLAIADPDKIEGQGHWNKELFAKIRELGATIVRIPIHPVAWRERTPEKYLKLLDQAIEWCTDESLYVVIDWHSIGNLEEGLFQNPEYNTSLQETYNFWRTIAAHYRGVNTIAFFELFNEPTDDFGMLGNLSWDQWKTINENLIKLIRAYGDKAIPLVAGFDWAYDLTPLRFAPIDAQGIGYVTHPYPQKRKPPYALKWDEDFGFAAKKYPVVATELGFTMWNSQDNLDYGETIIRFLETNHISWIWWVFDPQWMPNMITSYKTFTLTKSGEFFERAAKGEFTAPDSTVSH